MTPSPSSITTNDLDDLLSFVVEYQAITLAQIFTNIGKADTTPQPFPKPITFTHYTVESLLILAIHLADALHTVHQQYPVHGNLNPTAIFIEATQPQTPHTIQIHILDPDTAIKSGLGQQLSYIAPEQTGRLEHTSDHRADLYSLGVIFYQMLTGQLPFTISDPLALVYAHIAINSSPPIEVNPILPLPLSNIVLKLLAKDPWDRYQSAATLRADLKKCLVCWQSFGQIETFSLGQSDFVDQLVLPEKLYGRGHEQSQLSEALDEVRTGIAKFVLLIGESGIGKTTLMDDFLGGVITQGGLTLTSQAKAIERDIPYAAAIGVLQNFVHQLLIGEADQIAIWQKRLPEALAGYEGQLLGYIPELGLLLNLAEQVSSEPSSLPVLLNLAIQNLFKVIVESEQLVVIFLDDAHEADPDSLHLLHKLANNCMLPLLVIWACRDDLEIPHYLQKIKLSLLAENLLVLLPLGLEDCLAFLADVLHSSVESVSELAKLIYRKTKGNPLFMGEFLRLLYRQGLLFFDFHRRVWTWDMVQIQETSFADSAVGLVRDRLQLLPELVQRVLKVAAIMGRQFKLEFLAMACGRALVEVAQDLGHLLDLGVVVPLAESLAPSFDLANEPTEPRAVAIQQLATRFVGADLKEGGQTEGGQVGNGEMEGHYPSLSGAYQFVHEQVWVAARLLLPALSEGDVHWQVGWRLWQGMSLGQREENLFLLGSQLNGVFVEGVSRPEQITIAQVNLQAGQKGIALMAYENALSFSLFGIKWLGIERGWQENGSLMRDLYLTAVQAATRLGYFGQLEQLLEIVEKHSISILDQLTIIRERIVAFYLQGKHQEAITIALSALSRLGINLPQKPGKRHVAVALLQTQLTLARKPVQRLTALPPMTDAHRLKGLELLVALTIPAASVNANLLVLIGLEIIRQTLRYGSHPLSAMGYALYGLVLCGVTGQIERGYAFGQLALQQIPQITSKEYRVFVKYFVYAHINHWKEPIQATLRPVRQLSTTGEFEYLALAAGLYPYLSWFINQTDLGQNEKSIAENMHLLEPFKNTPLYYRYQLGQQYYQNLLGQSEQPTQMVGDVYDERQLLPRHLAENDRTTIFYLACHKLTLCYLFGDYEQALIASQLAIKHQDGGVGTPLIPVLYFYDSLTRLALYPTVATNEAKRLLAVVVSNQRKMKHWAKHGPANCLHRYNLVMAEQSRVLGQANKARELYDQAIYQAQEQEFLPELGLAHEVAANFYLGIGQPAYAEYHLGQAYRNYRVWGALGKLKQMEVRFPRFLSGVDLTSFTKLSAYLDMSTLFKATQILSSETVLPSLIDALTAILIENAGAQYGCLLLLDGGSWRVVSQKFGEFYDESLPTQPDAPKSIIWKVARSREPLLVNDVAIAYPASVDPYLRLVCPRSFLCLPLLNKGELEGVFYMDNRLTRQAFSVERLPLLMMLANQAAVSLKNGSLVAGLQKARQNIEVSEARFRLLFENVPLGILEIDIDALPLKIRTANRRAEALYGWSNVELMLLDPILLVPDESRPEMERLLEMVRKGKTGVIESLNRRRDGSVFPVRIIATPVQSQHGMQMIATIEDITAQQNHRSEMEAIAIDRQRIAQEIHDGVAQNLAFLRLKLSLWHDWVVAEPGRVQNEINQTQTILDDTIIEIRRSIYALRPLAFETSGLLALLPHYVTTFQAQHKLYVTLHVDLPEEQLSSELELLLFRLIQETLNNIGQHAQASLAWIHLTIDDQHLLRLTVRDNGCGFDVANLNRSGRAGHLGLLQMRERVENANGRLTIISRPGQGTEIQIELPIS